MLSKQNQALIRVKLLLVCWGFVAHTWAGGLGVGEDFGKRGSGAEAGSGFGLVVVLSNKDAEAIEYFFPVSTEKGRKTLCKIKAIQPKKTATKSTNHSTIFGKATFYEPSHHQPHRKKFQAGDINLFRYVGNGVVKLIDPYGKSNALWRRGRCCNSSDIDEWALLGDPDGVSPHDRGVRSVDNTPPGYEYTERPCCFM